MTGNQDRAARAAAWADARQDDLMAIIDADLAAIKAAAPTSEDPGAAERRVRAVGVFARSVRAVVALSHSFGQRFVARGRGGLVLFSSLVAFQGVPRAANYAATKAFIQSFAEGLRLELAPRGVDVVAAAPGPIASGFATRASMQMSMAGTPVEVARDTLAGLGRTGTVRPGFLSKFLELSLSTLPRWGRVRMMAIVMAGMTPRMPNDALPAPRRS
jgi:short-subunit dehydrogenase